MGYSSNVVLIRGGQVGSIPKHTCFWWIQIIIELNITCWSTAIQRIRHWYLKCNRMMLVRMWRIKVPPSLVELAWYSQSRTASLSDHLGKRGFPDLNSAWNWNLKRQNSTSAYAIIDFGLFWARYSRFQAEKSNIPYFSMSRGVAGSVSTWGTK